MPPLPERPFDPTEITAIRVTKFLVSFVFHVLEESSRALRRLAGRELPASTVAIYYHHVPDDQREMFTEQMDHLLRWTAPLRADCAEPLRCGGRYSMVTADDGWASFARNAVPVLVRRSIPVTIFAISERLGDSVDGVTTDRIVTEERLRELRADGVTIGSHTARHARMTSLDEGAAALELTDSRLGLSRILGEDVNLFCFPYGASDSAMVELCRRSGYRRAFTCMPYLADVREFEIGRIRVDPTDWRLEFHLKLMGAYRWVPMAIAFKRRIFGWLRGSQPNSDGLKVVEGR